MSRLSSFPRVGRSSSNSNELGPRGDVVTTASCLLAALVMFDAPSATGQATSVFLDTTGQRMVGGVTELDRARFFAHQGTLAPPSSISSALWETDGLRTSPSRVSTEFDQFIAQGLPEDPARPGFFEPNALQNKIESSYNPFINSGSRWAQLRNAENPILINSGRNASFFPAFLRTDPVTGYTHPNMVMNNAGYADFLVQYLTHADIPIDSDRFFIEVMNEPNNDFNANFGVQDMIDLHVEVANGVRAVFPDQKIGGPSFCCSDFGSDNMDRWFTELKPFMDQAVDDMDFISVHPYDRYTVKSDGSYQRDFAKGAGHMAAMMDVIESHASNLIGEVKPMAFTEYGSWNRTEMADGSYGTYAREQQQWDLVRDIREKLFVTLDRPDRVLSGSPFVGARHWQNAVPTNADGDNVLWEQDVNGVWQETIVAKMFRMYAPVEGRMLGTFGGDPDLQVQVYRDGDQVFVMLNNLRDVDHDVNLGAILGSSSQVTAAMIDRIQLINGVPTHVDDQDVFGSWQNLTLSADEGAVLTLNVSGPQIYNRALNTETYYGSETAQLLDAQGSSELEIDADLTDAVSAVARIGFVRPANAVNGEAIQIFVNGSGLLIPSGELGLDDDDYSSFLSREVEVPVSLLVDGVNDIRVDFVSSGGYLSSAVLEITRTIGEYDGNQLFTAADIDALFAAQGATDVDGRFDLAGSDGVVDDADIDYWLTELRGTVRGDANLDGEVGLLDLDILGANWNQSDVGWGGGDFNGDGVVSLLDLDILGSLWGTNSAFGVPDFAAAASAAGLSVPEPSSLAILVLTGLGLNRRRR